jgi:bifunctional non-homologous end joining protein LigD
MKPPLAGLSDEAREELRRRGQPSRTNPMLASLTHEPFSDEGWIYERKLDGERCLAFRAGKKVRLRSRNQQSLNATYPELVEALSKQRCDHFLVDGEVVTFKGGVTSFSRLQQRMQIQQENEARASNVAVYYYLFGILHVDGHDVTRLPLRERKSLLKRALDFQDPLRFTAHRVGAGEAYFKQACRKGWEGVIAKKADSRYVHRRSHDWLKFKCTKQQEFVVGGYTDPQGSRVGFGALLIGYYQDGKLRYAGMVGAGFDDDTLRRLTRQLKRAERETAPFVDEKLPGKHVHWVQPALVLQAGFTEWTDGKLRHPRFLGLRRDKKPTQVAREAPRK